MKASEKDTTWPRESHVQVHSRHSRQPDQERISRWTDTWVHDRITYRSITLSSLSARKWAAGHSWRLGPLVKCSWLGSLDCPYGLGCSGSNSGTAPESTLSVLWCPPPRSGVSAACRLRRLAARASSQLRVWPETGAGVARRLNGLP